MFGGGLYTAFADFISIHYRKSPATTAHQNRFFAAGSFGNFIVAGVSILILLFVFNPMFTSNGVFYQAVAHDLAGNAQGLVQVLGLELQRQVLPGCDHRPDLQEFSTRP